MRRILRALLALALLLVATAERAQDITTAYPQARAWFPEADRFGLFEGEPRAAPAYASGQVVGYVFLTNDVVRIPAYSGHPINSLVGFDLTGRIRGVAIVEHHEPILAVGVSEERLRAGERGPGERAQLPRLPPGRQEVRRPEL
jgi:transcriptional regulator of nitric oxide reductase